MICNKCGSEWRSLGTTQIIFCPFCDNPLNEVDRTFDSLESVLDYLVADYGDDILRSKRSVIRFLEYYLPGAQREVALLDSVYAGGLMDAVFRTRRLPDTAQAGSLKQIQFQLREKYGVSADWAQYIMGCICKSLKMMNDLDSSIIGLKRKAEDGDGAAQYEVSKAYLLGRHVERDKKKHLAWLEKAVDNEYSPALYQMGLYLFEGTEYARDEKRAVQYMVRAASLGNVDAICFIGQREDIRAQCDLDIDALIQKVSGSTDDLTVSQLINLCLYHKQTGNENVAMQLAERAYKLDPKAAWKDYYNILFEATAAETRALALRVLREAAADGNCEACKMLGAEYESRAATEKDMLTALYWLRMAAGSGDVDAQVHIAEIYEHGDRIPVDIEKAVYWYRAAAYNGSLSGKKKISYKSKECLLKTITLTFGDDSELECRVIKAVCYRDKDYLIVMDPVTKEKAVLQYREVHSLDGFEIEAVDEKTEDMILRQNSSAFSLKQ